MCIFCATLTSHRVGEPPAHAVAPLPATPCDRDGVGNPHRRSDFHTDLQNMIHKYGGGSDSIEGNRH